MPVILGAGLGHFYDSQVTLIQASLAGMILAASVQTAMRAGVFSLASIGFWGIGAYTAGILAREHDAGVATALTAAVLLSAAVSYVLALLFVRLRGLYLAMATMSFNLVVIVIALDLEDLTGGALGLYGVPPILEMWQLLVAVAAVAGILAYLERGHLGRTIATVGSDEELASSLGIRVRTVQRRTFVLSGVLGALAGGMSALLFNTVSTDQFGFHFVTLALTMAVIGGLRSWLGSYLGAVIVYWLPELLRPIDEWRSVVYGALLVAVVTLEPGGLIGLWRRLRSVLTPRRRHNVPAARTEAAAA